MVDSVRVLSRLLCVASPQSLRSAFRHRQRQFDYHLDKSHLLRRPATLAGVYLRPASLYGRLAPLALTAQALAGVIYNDSLA